jgi:hypothetical protein
VTESPIGPAPTTSEKFSRLNLGSGYGVSADAKRLDQRQLIQGQDG